MSYLLRWKQHYMYVLFIFFIAQNIVAQEKEFVIPDSLKNKTYGYLFSQVRNDYTNTFPTLIYLNTAFKKAIIEDNKANQSYSLLLFSYFEKDKNDKLDLIKKSIEKSKEVDSIHSLLPRLSLGTYYHSHFEYEKALQEYLKALNTSKEIGNKEYTFKAQHHIAQIKRAIGKHSEALDLYKKCFEYEKSRKNKDSISFTRTLMDLAESMLYLKKHDSATYYYDYITEKGYKKDTYYINIANINQGINLYEIGNFKQSEILLKKGSQEIDLNNTNNYRYYILSQFYLGKINQLTQVDSKKAKEYFLTVDSLFTATNIIVPETRAVYEFFITDYKKQKNFNAQLLTINKLIKFDSIISSRKIRTANKLHLEYDTPELLKSKETIIQNLEHQTTVLSKRAVYLGISTIVLMLLFVLQHRKYKNRFNTIISELDNQKTKKISNHNAPITQKTLLDGIDETTITTILNNLNQFEEKKGFLQKDITLAILAKKCNTNTKYLPKIITTYKNKTFVNYINNLRIDYILKELKENTTLQKYTIKTISEESGFSTPESFARAFKNKTNIRPSYYIRNLKKKEQV